MLLGILCQDLLGTGILCSDELGDLLIDDDCRLLTVRLLEVLAIALRVSVVEIGKFVTHTVIGDHSVGELDDTL